MDPLIIGLLIFFVLILMFILCIFSSKSSQWRYPEIRKRRKWNKYVQSLQPEKQREIYEIIKSYSNDDFHRFLLEIENKLKHRYDPCTFSDSTILQT